MPKIFPRVFATFIALGLIVGIGASHETTAATSATNAGGIVSDPVSATYKAAPAVRLETPTNPHGVEPTEGGCFSNDSCKHRVPKDSNPAAVNKCIKQGLANGAVAATVAATVTSPVDVPGVVVTGTVTFLGTAYFCSIGWT